MGNFSYRKLKANMTLLDTTVLCSSIMLPNNVRSNFKYRFRHFRVIRVNENLPNDFSSQIRTVGARIKGDMYNASFSRWNGHRFQGSGGATAGGNDGFGNEGRISLVVDNKIVGDNFSVDDIAEIIGCAVCGQNGLRELTGTENNTSQEYEKEEEQFLHGGFSIVNCRRAKPGIVFINVIGDF